MFEPDVPPSVTIVVDKEEAGSAVLELGWKVVVTDAGFLEMLRADNSGGTIEGVDISRDISTPFAVAGRTSNCS